jgi:primosomal protein N' (replication factor Y)
MWHAALLSAPYSTLTYGHPSYIPENGLAPGFRVLVPLGRSLRQAVLVKRVRELPADFPKDVQLKDVLWPVEHEPLLDEAYMEMAETLAGRQMAEVGRILETLIPAGLRSVKFSFKVQADGAPATMKPGELAARSDKEKAAFWNLWEQGRMRVKATKAYAKEHEYCHLLKDPPWPVRPGAKRQLEVLEYLFDSGVTPRPALMRDLGQGAAKALDALVAKELVGVGEHPEITGAACENPATDPPKIVPTPEQKACLEDLEAALAEASPKARLVHGVTGSGKTLVYMRLAEKALAMGRSVIMLAPEVALACLLHRRAVNYLRGADVILYHGYMPPSERERVFMETSRRKEPAVVVGTRSALFLPVSGVGLIVLDEEHDTSFKQEERLGYQAKEVAYFRARRAGALLVLGSATPDVKTFHAAEQGHVGLDSMKNRVGESTLPTVEMVDISNLGRDDGPFAPKAEEALRGVVERGEQAVIMLNRRGYAPLMYCLDCGKVARCGHCDVGLTYHKSRERLVCHYCGDGEPFPSPCKNCGGVNYLPMGGGTERVEEALSVILPEDTGILRLDRDSARRPGRMEEILSDFAAGKAQVLVGTQMLSKGHHFPNVTLALVADGDLGLNIPDYRAAERTFQLLVQVSGRSGRGGIPGRVLIQTRDVDHYCWRFVAENDYAGFYEQEVAKRKRYGYPPFVKLGLVRLSCPAENDQDAERIMALAAKLMPVGSKFGARVLGPAPAPLGLLRGRKRYQLMIKAGDWPSVRNVFACVRRELAGGRNNIRASLDLDPVNML